MTTDASIAVVGYSCRLPGAGNASAYWDLLASRRSAIRRIGADRFPTRRYYHPVPGQAGRSYTFAAGTIDDVWGFDAAAFGISPREAEQMDPQQRHLLEVAFDALHHAGIPPSSLFGARVGVFVGASSLDYAARFLTDPAAADMHMMTGNTLSLIGNRLSYVLGLHGPSITVDTACSSSLVALCMAADAIRSGDIDTAIVGGVNLLLSPFPFLGFARAAMLSHSGMCRPFDAAADGYVRAEGAVTLILRRADLAAQARNRVYAEVAGWATGQDGRTTGISLPSADAQVELLEKVYDGFGLEPRNLAFVEAHGPGTPVGDPIEADALGRALGHKRRRVLPIGSVKSNVGHLEPASGLAGALKAVLALEHKQLPASLHFDTPNPAISFDDLNLAVAGAPRELEANGELLAGVNSFGFGGSIAHVVLRQVQSAPRSGVLSMGSLPPLMLSAHTKPALRELARRFLENWPADDVEARDWIDAAAHTRDQLAQRVAIRGTDSGAVREGLEHYLAGNAGAIAGEALGAQVPVCFAFSGNGAQWTGMGRNAWKHDRAFRAALEEVDGRFAVLTGLRPAADLFATDLEDRLRFATTSQPLLFACQYAIVRALGEAGLRPAAVIGHSMGEIAAAWAAGALDLDDAVRIVDARSRHQERTRGSGGMVAVMLDAQEVRRALSESGLSGVEIAAINSPRSITLTGTDLQLVEFMDLAKERRWSAVRLGLDYPFHSGLVEAVRDPLLDDLKRLRPRRTELDLFSTVTGARAAGGDLDGLHWWRNVRQPVEFLAATGEAIKAGYRMFVEIGPRPILLGSLRDTLRHHGVTGAAIGSLSDRPDEEGDRPIDNAVARAFVAGAQVDIERIFGPVRGQPVTLPEYPWQHKPFRVKATPEATSAFTEAVSVMLGVRPSPEADSWLGVLDTGAERWLADHKVGGSVLLPAAGFAEVMLAAARAMFATEEAEVRDLDIFQPLVLADGMAVETLTRVNRETGAAEFLSRPRLSGLEWTLHAKARLVRHIAQVESKLSAVARDSGEKPRDREVAAKKLYSLAHSAGFDYGPAFRRVTLATVTSSGCVDMELGPPSAGVPSDRFVLDPTALDASFHGLIALLGERMATGPTRMIPVRVERLLSRRSGSSISRARLTLVRRTGRSAVLDVDLMDGTGAIVAEARGLRFATAPTLELDPATDFAYDLNFLKHDAAGAPSRLSIQTSPLVGVGKKQKSAVAALELLECASLRMSWDASQAWRATTYDELPRTTRILQAAMLAALQRARLGDSCDLPPLPDTVRLLLGRHPTFGAEAACLAYMGESLRAACVAGNAATGATSYRLPDGAATLTQLRTAALRAMRPALQEHQAGRLVRLLVVGADHGDIAADLAREFANLEIVVVDADERRISDAEANWAHSRSTRLVWRPFASLQEFHAGTFDAALAIDSLHRIALAPHALASVRQALRPNAPIIVAELAPSLFWDLMRGGVSGKADTWWQRTIHPEFPISALMSAEDWRVELEDAGFLEVDETAELEPTLGIVLGARAGRPERLAGSHTAERPAVLVGGHRNAIAAALEETAAGDERASSNLVWFAKSGKSADPSGQLVNQLAGMAAFIRGAIAGPCRTWVVVPWCGTASTPLEDPTATALQAAARVARNEFPDGDVRCILLDDTMQPDDAAAALWAEIVTPAEDTEIAFRHGERLVPRVTCEMGSASAEHDPVAEVVTRLERGAGGLPAWQRVERSAPGQGAVEIEVQAAGLNFRDVMWSLGLLPDEALEGGYAGAALGMECAGRVVRLGPGVTDLKVGDPVVALAPASLASHAIAPRQAVLPLPPDVPLEAAATMPVAFLTAWYALRHLGRLKAGEKVLIHGAAGGVGLAALQVARHCGAETFVTAGTPEKRSLLQSLGADHVLDSRSLQFADDIMEITNGRGVDVVLNSLAGEAMVRSLGCVAPFGRFLELGKRDFYLNSYVPMRPLRDNVSYHAIDVDRLISKDNDLAGSILQDVVACQAAGELGGLPYRVYDARHSDQAFRAMQRSQHIGKVVILPAERGQVRDRRSARFVADSHGMHVVVGGLGGFGFATACWLAARGAKHLLLIGRNVSLTDEQRRVMRELAEDGVTVETAQLDVTDAAATAAFLRDIQKRRPVKGIVHAAMVLDDRLIANLDEAAIREVVAPKVAGALNLHEATRKLRLDYFLMYSSATTLIGNPGQFNYVAANAFLEGLARQRRAAGLPATTVSWGAIGDVGYLARNVRQSKTLQLRLGPQLLNAEDALGCLDRLLRPDAEATSWLARIDWRRAGRELNIGSAAAFRWVVPRADASDIGAEGDLLKTLTSLSPDDREDVLSGMVRREIARSLRLPIEEISLSTPLAEIGMDSLMMLELRSAIEQQAGIEFPMISLANGLAPIDLVRRIAQQLGSPLEKGGEIGGAVGALAGSHISDQGLQAERYVRGAREVVRRASTRKRLL